MKQISQAFLVVIALMAMGCYTRFATFDQDPMHPGHHTAAVDSTGQNNPRDSLAPAEDETCVWERDLMGFPYLRCYKGYYPRDWYRYNFSPWWYHTDEYRYDPRRRCPPYYYYDQNCGCCRYYLNNPVLERSARRPSRKQPRTDTVPIDSAAIDSTDRVNISASTRVTVTAPIHGHDKKSKVSPKGTALLDTLAQRKASTADSSAQEKKQAAADSVAVDSTAKVSDTARTNRNTIKTRKAKKIRRSTRGF
ncbi:MAG: hypothetical protein JW768_00835 [Chitinispirillaceae bacterium]|nr:hypothetical protein [Chitinispirillaceae bacterium]